MSENTSNLRLNGPRSVSRASFDDWYNEEVKRWEEANKVILERSIPDIFNKKLNIKEYIMTINEYQQLALRTEPPTDDWKDRITNGLMGLNGEAGEAIDIIKKHFFHKHPLNREHLAKELGDVAWYLAVTADAIDYKLEDIFQMNIDKLKARYPDGFDSERSKHRQAGDI